VGRSLRSFSIPPPSRDDLVRAYRPELGHKPDFLSSFPEVAQDEIISKLADILQEYSPSAARDREQDVATLYFPDGVSMTTVCEDLVRQCPFILIKYPNGAEPATIRHLMSAPALNRKTKEAYKNRVHVKIALGQNNKKEDLPLVLLLFYMFQFKDLHIYIFLQAHPYNAMLKILIEMILRASGQVASIDIVVLPTSFLFYVYNYIFMN
jgi:hypothetical protein